ncbi:MAG: tRNA uridine-5-carboxymethylaminomethyl(34) synthesis GTPase MnmE [Bacteroidales bacterium]|jgi:tRNA modification GTPase|nr:tRNA uridine-5-carboxymethylaminomethyl(34) synthesis GTPase MnmE [Bacteroidales bacterium]
MLHHLANNDTICALATPPGTSAIALIRLSGPESFNITDSIFVPYKKGDTIQKAEPYTIHFGKIFDENVMLDQVLVSVFKSPHSYTGEDSVEISCHGSTFIQQKLIELLLKQGARMAEAGEYTLRAFFNGKFDLSQAEAVADLIASNSSASHNLALEQIRGGFSAKIKTLRQELVDLASLIELELDFAEEDVEFADRTRFLQLLAEISKEINQLIESFALGNVIKHGIPVAIIGKTNAGKSTLLNRILQEEKAIVSEIPGTTRDSIEDTISIEGFAFRFIDTAGLRSSTDKIENLGIERTYEKIRQSKIILYVCDITQSTPNDLEATLEDFKEHIEDENKRFILIGNKIDELVEMPHFFNKFVDLETIFVSAKRNENINLILDSLVASVKDLDLGDNTIVSNARHLGALNKVAEAINAVEIGFHDGIPTDLIAIDIRTALHYLGEITGEVTNNELLGNIFGKFCIGK